MKKLCCVLLTFIFLIGMVTPAFAATALPVTVDITEEDGASAIISALYRAGELASDEAPFTIQVGAGRYEIDRALHIFSNTRLVLDENAVIVNNASGAQGDNMLKVGITGDDPASGYYYKNITVEGGRWDGNGKNATMFKFVHAENCILNGVTAYNLKDAHYVEMAGVNGMQVLSCNFSRHIISTKNGTEAIQIDVLQQDHIAGYAHLDDEIDVLCKNINIDGCTFTGVRRAIGSHTAVLGKYYENVRITNNRFINSTEKSILCFNMRNLLIEGNEISGESVGIEIKTMDQGGMGSYLSATTKGYVQPIDLLATVCNNTVKSNTDHAIFVNGVMINSDIPAKKENNDKVFAGQYFVKGVNIHDNTVTAYGKKCAIKVQFAKNVTVNQNIVTEQSTAESPIYINNGCQAVDVTGNTVLSKVLNGIRVCNLLSGYPKGNIGSISDNTVAEVITNGYGIRVSDAAVNSIENNEIKKSVNLGIQVDKNTNIVEHPVSVQKINSNIIRSGRVGIKLMTATVTDVSGNKIYPTTSHSLLVDSKCKVGKISNNIISKSGGTAILSRTSTVNEIVGNKIAASASHSLMADAKSVVGKIHGNVISAAGGTAIIIHQSKVSEVSSNTITSPKGNGIYAYGGYGVDTIIGNKISDAGDSGIIANGVTIKSISANVISSCKNFGIYINGNNTSTYIAAVKGNRLNACTNPIKILKGSKVNLYVNAAASNRSANKYVINGSRQYTLGNVATVSLAAKKSGNTIRLNWAKKSTVSGYMIYRSTKSTSGFVKIGTASANAKLFTDKKTKAKVVYYYRILPYLKVAGSNVVMYGNVTQSKAVKR